MPKLKYEPPEIVPLGELAVGQGDCDPGSIAQGQDERCNDGGSAFGDCNDGGSALGGRCNDGGSAGPD